MYRSNGQKCKYWFRYIERYWYIEFISKKPMCEVLTTDKELAVGPSTMKPDDDTDERNQDLEETAEIMPELISTEAWNTWKKMMISVQPDMKEHGKQLALYMHCMIQ